MSPSSFLSNQGTRAEKADDQFAVSSEGHTSDSLLPRSVGLRQVTTDLQQNTYSA